MNRGFLSSLCLFSLLPAARVAAAEQTLWSVNISGVNEQIEALEKQGNAVKIKSLVPGALTETVVVDVQPGAFSESAPRERVLSGKNGDVAFNSAVEDFEGRNYTVDAKLFAVDYLGAIHVVAVLTPGSSDTHLLYVVKDRSQPDPVVFPEQTVLMTGGSVRLKDFLIRFKGPRPAPPGPAYNPIPDSMFLPGVVIPAIQ